MRPTVLLQRQDFAVQDDRLNRQRVRHLDQLGHTGGDVVETAREDPHILAQHMDLDAGAVELPFDRRRGDPLQRFGDARRRLSQHRLHRLTHL